MIYACDFIIDYIIIKTLFMDYTIEPPNKGQKTLSFVWRFDCNNCYVEYMISDIFSSLVDPPSSPNNLRQLQIGSTWAHVRWEPPSENGSLPLSNYKIVAFPLLNSSNDTFTSSYSNCTMSNNETQDDTEINTACNEVECRETDLTVSSSVTSANVTGLIPALMYLLVVNALSNGTNLESEPSNAITFTTDMHGNLCVCVCVCVCVCAQYKQFLVICGIQK